MAVVPHSSNTWILSLKVLLISIGVLFVALLLKLYVPLILDFALVEVPLVWSSLCSWLTPPYLYFVINGIIITIAASSRLQQKKDEYYETLAPTKAPADQPAVVLNPIEMKAESSYDDVLDKMPPSEIQPELVVMPSPAMYEQSEAKVSEERTEAEASEPSFDDDDFVISRSTWTPSLQRGDSSEIPSDYSSEPEKPLVSARFSHRKPVKSSPEGGKALRVSKPKRHETLENTWKTITEGRPIPLTRHLKKSDTWETHGHHNNTTALDPPPRKTRKSDTLKDRTNEPSEALVASSPAPGKLRKEPSLGQDDLNRRVEAFIKKFNEEMRLQRQQSLNQYREMISGALY